MAGGEQKYCNWAILESNGKLSINFLISAHKSTPEVAGPAFYDCPEYFFELVPEEDATWREQVRDYWRQLATEKYDNLVLTILIINLVEKSLNMLPIFWYYYHQHVAKRTYKYTQNNNNQNG